ncbi:MAG: hypothetical protein H0U71_00590 [Gammaproteobacteria bacterium]|nr:hypothetical protein [Gammaproteobacteria bacterium]
MPNWFKIYDYTPNYAYMWKDDSYRDFQNSPKTRQVSVKFGNNILNNNNLRNTRCLWVESFYIVELRNVNNDLVLRDVVISIKDAVIEKLTQALVQAKISILDKKNLDNSEIAFSCLQRDKLYQVLAFINDLNRFDPEVVTSITEFFFTNPSSYNAEKFKNLIMRPVEYVPPALSTLCVWTMKRNPTFYSIQSLNALPNDIYDKFSMKPFIENRSPFKVVRETDFTIIRNSLDSITFVYLETLIIDIKSIYPKLDKIIETQESEQHTYFIVTDPKNANSREIIASLNKAKRNYTNNIESNNRFLFSDLVMVEKNGNSFLKEEYQLSILKKKGSVSSANAGRCFEVSQFQLQMLEDMKQDLSDGELQEKQIQYGYLATERKIDSEKVAIFTIHKNKKIVATLIATAYSTGECPQSKRLVYISDLAIEPLLTSDAKFVCALVATVFKKLPNLFPGAQFAIFETPTNPSVNLTVCLNRIMAKEICERLGTEAQEKLGFFPFKMDMSPQNSTESEATVKYRKC